MCRMLGVVCSDDDLLGCAIHEVHSSLRISNVDKHDGVGVGYYVHDDPLLMKRPSAAFETIDYRELVNEISSNVLMVHVRKATVGGWKDVNTHPFRFRRWLFSHVGHLPPLEKNRKELLETMPPFLLRNIRGDTESEVCFHMILNLLFKAGRIDDLSLASERLAGFLKEGITEIDQLAKKDAKDAKEAEGKFAIMVTNGQVMAGACRGIPMYYSHREGIFECGRHEATEQEVQRHRRFRGIMIGAEMVDPGHQWREVADGTLLSVSKDLKLKVDQL